ncbi:MAG: hypothetical protein ACBZ72_11705 [Candidatus Bathyarchaeia archaeon]|jgi:hypothetical protein
MASVDTFDKLNSNIEAAWLQILGQNKAAHHMYPSNRVNPQCSSVRGGLLLTSRKICLNKK